MLPGAGIYGNVLIGILDLATRRDCLGIELIPQQQL